MTRRDELDSHLLQLAISAQRHPSRSQERQLALTKLVNAIVRADKLCRPQKSQFPAGVYEDIYNEARQELFFYICQNIDKYEPERGSVMAWVNVLLDRRFFKDAIRKIQTHHSRMKMTIADLDNFASPEKPKDLTEILKEYIESDP
ncbi:sigma-70 family RNA polymerase sigma factor, partial [Scytonema sp. NUACC26]|uniref:sigma-70 family RNA polymerase sigma factor n=1 Tax=Scytonema sp. NUACC26 TaxID=3140176 RepID=UPI0038B3EB1F